MATCQPSSIDSYRSTIIWMWLPAILLLLIATGQHSSECGYMPTLGCPRLSLWSETKRNGSENERSEIAKQKVSFAGFAMKPNGKFCVRNEMIRSEKYRKEVSNLIKSRISAQNRLNFFLNIVQYVTIRYTHTTLTHHSHNSHTILTQYSHNTHTILTQYSHQTHTKLTKHSLNSQHSLNTHSTLT